ncbi:MAG: hypothetical protein E7192_03200 [Erysipelotrichaceae bacterium]|nr:hypothetical protein [Erysipelotrichaceae bacterium]
MKRTITKLISALLAAIMCFSIFPINVFAWGKMTHIYTANLIEQYIDTDDNVSLSYPYDAEEENGFNFAIPDEFVQAIADYPDAFRAGSLGPDMYPDIVTGQMYIHPEDENIDSGEWVTLLCNAVNKMGKDTEGRKLALAFTLGSMLHYCGDLFGHDFVNTFSGGTFPSVANLEMMDLKSERLNNVLSHLSVEKYMDSLLYPSYNTNRYGSIDAPDEFVSNVMVFNGTPGAGLAPLYDHYPKFDLNLNDIDSDLIKDIFGDFFDENSNNVPPHYTAMLALREYVTSTADEYRENMEPVSAAITRYNDEWAADIDKGMIAFTEACDNIARRMVTKEKNPVIEQKKQEDREDEKNQFWDFSELNLESMILNHYPEKEVDKIEKKLMELDLYGDSFFDLVLIELLLKGIITPDMLRSESSSVMIIKEEFSFWMDEYGVYMLGIPDIIIDGIDIPVIGDIMDLIILKPIWSWIGGEIKNLAAQWVVSACTGKISHLTGLEAKEAANKINDLVSKIDDRLEDPELQLNHPDNPYKPSENNFAELEDHLKTLTDEKRYSIGDSQVEALYNTLTMFKLVLMGPENYTRFIEENTGIKQTAYLTNTGHLEASALNFQIQTSDLYLAGTDDNIYVTVYKTNENGSRTQLIRKLLDKSGYNDFESGDNDHYLVELPEAVKLDQLEIALSKTPAFDFLPSLTDDWHCENIRVTPMYAGYELCDSIDLGGIHLKGICKSVVMNFTEALQVRGTKVPQSQAVTNLKVRIKVSNTSYAGSDSDIYLVAYNGNDRWAKVCLDKAVYNDLEKGDDDTYIIPVGRYGPHYQSIPLDQLRIEFKHDGSDEANWKEVTITPCYGSLELTEPISFGGKKFEDSTWNINFQGGLKKAVYKQYDPILIEYQTSLDDGLLSYMGSLDGGEEWVDASNELWAKPTLRKDIFFEIFKGFEPEVIYTGESTALQGDPVDLAFDFTGVWNGVSNERRSQVKDFNHVYPVEGTADVEFINENNKVVYTASKVDVSNNFASLSADVGKLAPGYYDVRIFYAPHEANPMYADTTVTFEKALNIIKGNPLAVKIYPQDVTSEVGKEITLTVEATGGNAPYSYTWQRMNGSDWSVISDNFRYSGQGSNSLLLRLQNADIVENFRCIVKDRYGSEAISNVAAITVEKAPDPLIIMTQPQNVTVNIGQTATFTTSASGGRAPYTYMWQVLSADGWVHVESSDSSYSGQGTNTLICNTNNDVETQVRCVISDADGKSVTSSMAEINIIYPLAVQINNGEVEFEYDANRGQSQILTANVTGGTSPYTYTWYMWEEFNSTDWEVASTSQTCDLSTLGVYCDTKIKVEVQDTMGQRVTSREIFVHVIFIVN